MEAGVFPREERLELLAGELTRREAVSPRAAAAICLMYEALTKILPPSLRFPPLREGNRAYGVCPARSANKGGCDVRIQLPLAMSEYDEPFPDLAVCRAARAITLYSTRPARCWWWRCPKRR